MRILLTGATGYVGKRLLMALIEKGHDVICLVRDKSRLSLNHFILAKIEIFEVDFLSFKTLSKLPKNIDVAYYLIHSMTVNTSNFDDLEAKAANNFIRYIGSTKVRQVIYLGGIANHDHLSKHLASRKNVEEILSKGNHHLTVLRAGIIVGSGSASFEIIRDIVEKLPIMITPKWVLTKSQPIAIRDVITFLTGVLTRKDCYDKSFDIGGPEILTYKEMLLQYAEVRQLKRKIHVIPFFTTRLSSYWLFFITSVSYKLASNLVDSMKMEIVCRNNDLEKLLKVEPISYKAAIELAFIKIKQNLVFSSWKDSLSNSPSNYKLADFIEVPQFGCYRNEQTLKIQDISRVLNNIWSIGGERGYYYANWLWKIRGFFDQLIGGVGLNRGRTLATHIHEGDALDFWRVLYANREKKRFLLFAEMKLPGEAWLEFKIDDNNILHQIATFRPKGVWGRLYWISTTPFHYFIFKGMIRNIVRSGKE